MFQVDDALAARQCFAESTAGEKHPVHEIGQVEFGQMVPDSMIDELAVKAASLRGIARRKISEDEIVARIMTALANEGANILSVLRALDEAIHTSARVLICYDFAQDDISWTGRDGVADGFEPGSGRPRGHGMEPHAPRDRGFGGPWRARR